MVIIRDYPEHSEINPILYDIITDKCCMKHKYGAFATEWQAVDGNFFGEKVEAFDKLSTWINELLPDVARELHKPTQSAWPDFSKFNFYEYWGMFYPPDSATQVHCHFPFAISFGYYVNAPIGSSPLMIHDLRDIQEGNIEPLESVPLRNGRIVFFYGNTVHGVPPSSVDGRCMIAGNVTYTPDSKVEVEDFYVDKEENYTRT